MTTTLEITPGTTPKIRLSNTSLHRADAASTAPLEQAEREIESAKQKAEDLRIAIAARQERLEHLRAHRGQLAARLARLQNRDLGAQLAQSEEIFDRLFESSELTSPNRRIELESATHALAWLPAAIKRQGQLIERLKSELAEADKALADLESGK